DVHQELETKSFPFVRALDDAWNVGDDERAVVRELHDAEVGAERGERIVADLWSCRRDDREQRGLTGVGLADEANVGDELELELQRASLTVFARLVLARRLMRRRREERVAFAAAAALRDDDPVAILQHFAEQFRCFEISNDGSDGDWHDDVAAGATR